MNKQEAIEKVKTMTVETFFSGTLFVKQQEVIAIIEQIGEPTSGCAEEAKKSNKVVIPQFVADWIEVCKEHLTTSLYTAMNPNFMKGNSQSFDLILWIKKTSNQDIFARAWLDGYEVEKEKRYKIIILNPDDSHIMLFKLRDTTRMFFRDSNFEGKSGFECELTEKEVREHGFGWVFDCEGVKVEEVE